MRVALPVFMIAALAACQPPASDDYAGRSRVTLGDRGASEPIASPDTAGAVWAATENPDRLLYGKPGEHPLLALECMVQGGLPLIGYTRFARADANAKAILALIGNGHVSRLKIDAAERGEVWRWEGVTEAGDPALDVFTGARGIEATVPGAGSVILNPSVLPGDLVESCRGRAADEPASALTPAPALPAGPV